MMKPTRSLRIVLLLGVLAGFNSASLHADDANATKEADAPQLNKLEQAFADKMSGSVLVGTFTIDGKKGLPRTERYEIESATKVKDDYWTILARIQYGKLDVKVPITLKVLWAGDTPVMSLTNLTIPGVGTFTSRVMFHGDRYVGTWQHDAVGGHMFGAVEKQSPNRKKAPAPPK